MKKLAILAVLGIAVSAQAASIKWTGGSFLYGVEDGTATQGYTVSGGWTDAFKSPNEAAFVLVYLGVDAQAKSAADVSTSDIVQTAKMTDIVNTSTSTSKAGKASLTQTLNVADVVGATYQVFFSYNGVLKDIYTDSSLTTAAGVTATVIKDPDTNIFSTTPSPLYAAGGSGSSMYVSVPEPSVALMGLLGLGMLLKRRRA